MADFRIIAPMVAINVDTVKFVRGLAGGDGKKSSLMVTYIDSVESPIVFDDRGSMHKAWTKIVNNR